ncbi:DUF6777 domain-containing protein [Streptomyces sp. NBC_01092]|uniref:DUF6777 domain-containing protein n=1 Tax=Streptomyces sp. NBC_01092 TaxID=2903748 RepID=UPI00386CDB21|nr:hypothetical protein OG254_03035 [Streptomyces sp. NBC_01092]
MSVEPPSSDRPTGPPSGPLSGPSQPPSGPPSQPPSGGGAPAPGGGPEPHRPWWRSAPRIAALTAVVVAAVIAAVVLSRGGGSDGGTGQSGEVFLQAADKAGPDPFTESTATDSSAPPVTPPPPTEPTPSNEVRGVDGGAPGLYGGTRKVSSCDVEKQIDHLRAAPEKNRAFASVARVDAADVPAYLRSLTPVQLRLDTRVTNHGYVDGAATSYQAVLQAGTAVLVDDRGEPRVRCACGNPLTPPVAQQGTPRRTGDSWPSYRSSNVVVITPAQTIINVFVLFDADGDEWVARLRGDDGDKDRKTDRPAKPTPSASVTTPTSPTPPTTPQTSTPETSTPGTDTTEPPTTEPESPDTSAPQPPPDEDTTTTSQSAPTSAAPQSPPL